jgi:alkylation response protein AidB-like acyl-CoA dehydrogenase
MDFNLTDEQQLIRDTARQFADRELAERARENDRNHHFDTELIEKIAGQGYLGAIVPPEYGGAGLDYVTYAIVVEEIGRHDSAMRTVISVQTCRSCAAASGSAASASPSPTPAPTPPTRRRARARPTTGGC